MSTDLLILLVTALMAVVTTVAAIVATRAARQVAAQTRSDAEVPAPAAVEAAEPPVLTLVPWEDPDRPGTDLVAAEPAQVTRIVDGRVVVVPTPQQLVATALSRPTTRLDVLLHGMAHALRPESRDRITGMMRREFRQRRRARARAARRAARQPLPPAAPAAGWLGEEPREATS